jgi:hypothetical protein
MLIDTVPFDIFVLLYKGSSNTLPGHRTDNPSQYQHDITNINSAITGRCSGYTQGSHIGTDPFRITQGYHTHKSLECFESIGNIRSGFAAGGEEDAIMGQDAK